MNLEKEIELTRQKLEELYELRYKEEVGNLEINGKYILIDDTYIHVSDSWATGKKDDYKIIVNGEMFSFFMNPDYHGDNYISWEYNGQKDIPFRWFKEYGKEITKEEFEEKKKEMKDGLRQI